jgi:hypothetical protein
MKEEIFVKVLNESKLPVYSLRLESYLENYKYLMALDLFVFTSVGEGLWGV